MKNRHEKAQEQEDAWLDGSLADLAELSHHGAESGNSHKKVQSNLPVEDHSGALDETLDGFQLVPAPKGSGQSMESSKFNPNSKAKRDAGFHNRHGK